MIFSTDLCSPLKYIGKFFKSEPDEYKSFKVLFGFPFGALLAYGTYFFSNNFIFMIYFTFSKHLPITDTQNGLRREDHSVFVVIPDRRLCYSLS